MTSRDSIRLTAQGMIRNYKDSAAQEADAIAAKLGARDPDSQKLWSSVAREIRVLQSRP